VKSIGLWFTVCGVVSSIACDSDSRKSVAADGGTSQADADTGGQGPLHSDSDASTAVESLEDSGNTEQAPSTEDAGLDPLHEPLGHSREHDDSCRASCEAMFATGCPMALPVASCTSRCVSFLESILPCEDQDTAVNQCMAEKPLICDANGDPGVGYSDCAPELDAFVACVDSL